VDRVGAKLPPRAVVVGGALREAPKASERPLTREFSTGQPTKVGGAIRSSVHRRKVVMPRAKLHQRATAGAVLRSSGGRGRARGSHRLQKSTGGARPLSPMREERVDHEQGSSLPARERWRGERAPEAGSSVAKRRDRWRALHQIGNGEARKRSPGSTCRWKASRVVEVALIDEGAAEAVLVFEGLRVTGDREDDRGRQRKLARPHRRRQHSGGVGAPTKGTPTQRAPRGDAAAHRVASDRSWTCAVKRQANRGRIAARRSGATGGGRPSRAGSSPGVGAAKAACSVVERSTGTRVVSRLQRSVRSILHAFTEGSREVNRGDAG
jgi:hypothetical protein